MFPTARLEWDDLTPEQQIAECEWAAETLRRSRDVPSRAGNAQQEAAAWDRRAVEIRARL